MRSYGQTKRAGRGTVIIRSTHTATSLPVRPTEGFVNPVDECEKVASALGLGGGFHRQLQILLLLVEKVAGERNSNPDPNTLQWQMDKILMQITLKPKHSK